MRNEKLDAKSCTASSGVSLVSAARQEPQKWPLLEKGKLALASVGAMRNEQREGRKSANMIGSRRFPLIIVKRVNNADDAHNTARYQKTHNDNNRLFHSYFSSHTVTAISPNIAPTPETIIPAVSNATGGISPLMTVPKTRLPKLNLEISRINLPELRKNRRIFFLAFWGFASSVCTSMLLFYPINGCQASGGGVYLGSGTFRIVTGTIYGSNEADASLKNTASTSGAALFKIANRTAQRGTFSGEDWNSSGDFVTTEDTIRVVEGEYE
jgi:hypothetical protein